MPSIKIGNRETKMNWMLPTSSMSSQSYTSYMSINRKQWLSAQMGNKKSVRGFAGTPDFPVRFPWVQISNDLTLSSFPDFCSTTELEEHREEKQQISMC